MAHYTLIAYRPEGYDYHCGGGTFSSHEIIHGDLSHIIKQWARIEAEHYFDKLSTTESPFSDWQFTLLRDGLDMEEIDSDTLKSIRFGAKSEAQLAIDIELRKRKASEDAFKQALIDKENQRKALQ